MEIDEESRSAGGFYLKFLFRTPEDRDKSVWDIGRSELDSKFVAPVFRSKKRVGEPAARGSIRLISESNRETTQYVLLHTELYSCIRIQTTMKYEYPEAVQHFVQTFPDTFLYIQSICEDEGVVFFMIRRQSEKWLVLAPGGSQREQRFAGDVIIAGPHTYLICRQTKENAEALRERFPFTRPILLGKRVSFGFGDRLGNAGPAHLKAVRGTRFKPVLAQQSIRELERTGREAREVLDAASWAVFQEGFKEGFGADADHLKTIEDMDTMIAAGFTMFTIDPGEYVMDQVRDLPELLLEQQYQKLPWDELEDRPEALLERYADRRLPVGSAVLTPARLEVVQGMVKYGRVITHTKKMVRHLRENHPHTPAEFELSVDETSMPTTPFEHYLIASELCRLNIDLVSLAPRFCGTFEKGVDFRGDLDQFSQEFVLHVEIASLFGGYKLSLHSGSDKFSLYPVIRSLSRNVHIKTAGTSYLEALRVVAHKGPDLFRKILRFSISRFEEDNRTYNVSAHPPHEREIERWGDDELPGLLVKDTIRQVLHVAYGSVLSGDFPEARPFRSEMMSLLEENEEFYEQTLIQHFEKHLKPFEE